MDALPVRLEAVTKRYGASVALDAVTLNARPGEFLALLGPSGSGKTSLLMVVAGFLRPDAGRVYIGDRDVVRLPPNKRDIGLVFQTYALFPHMSVLGNVAFPLRVRRVARENARQRALAALSLVRLDGLADRMVSELSGGQRQRVALARAVVFEPRILLMDEPLSALDKSLREGMQLEIRRLHESLGITTIYVTHDQREALTMSDRVAVMNAGRIVQLDTPQAIYASPRNAFVARFIGEANLVPVAAIENAKLEGLGDRYPKGRVMVRAESLHLREPSQGASGRLTGVVRSVAFQGESWLVQLALAGDVPLMARIPRRDEVLVRSLERGQSVDLFLEPESTHVLADEDAHAP